MTTTSVSALRDRQCCGVTKPHEAHHFCGGSAPEFCGDEVLTAADANACDWLLIVRRHGLDIANRFYEGVTTP